MNRRLAGAIAWIFALQFFVSQGVVQSAPSTFTVSPGGVLVT